MVVCGETAGTVSRFRCIHLTVVRKHRQRLGQHRPNRRTAQSSSREESSAARSAISNRAEPSDQLPPHTHRHTLREEEERQHTHTRRLEARSPAVLL